MKGGNSGNNESEFDMADRKAFEAYCTNLEELFRSHCEVMRQGTVLQDSTPIIFNKLETTPEVRPEPSPSRNDVQSLINSALERQAKSTDELLRRLIVERNGKNIMILLLILLLLTLLVFLKSIHIQVVHRRAAH
jgi:hypothetical protein